MKQSIPENPFTPQPMPQFERTRADVEAEIAADDAALMGAWSNALPKDASREQRNEVGELQDEVSGKEYEDLRIELGGFALVTEAERLTLNAAQTHKTALARKRKVT